MDGDDYREMRAAEMKVKASRLKFNTELCLFIAAELGFDVKVMSEYHLRITIGTKRLDYYPQRGQSTWIGKGQAGWFRIDDIEKFLIKKAKEL